jgi:PBP1b-binding outer membrane lipoprotein LpoB
MKKTITILGLAILMISCNSNESKMKSGIKDYLDKNAKDPKSYEFIELKILDTVTVGEINKRIVDDLTYEIEMVKEDIVFQKKLISDFPSLPSDEEKSKINELELEMTNLTKELNANKKDFTSKDVVGYITRHKFRIKNGFGALDLSEMYVEFDKNFKLLEMDKDLNYSVMKIK